MCIFLCNIYNWYPSPKSEYNIISLSNLLYSVIFAKSHSEFVESITQLYLFYILVWGLVWYYLYRLCISVCTYPIPSSLSVKTISRSKKQAHYNHTQWYQSLEVTSGETTYADLLSFLIAYIFCFIFCVFFNIFLPKFLLFMSI